MTVELIHNEWPLQTRVRAIDGFRPSMIIVPCPWKLYYGKAQVRGITINKRCADSLKRVLAHVWDELGQSQDEIQKRHYHMYSGSYNDRNMRNSGTPSMHAFARAIDWNDAANRQGHQDHELTADCPLIAAFLAEGWEWGGNWHGKSIDAMHVQAAWTHDHAA